MLPISRRVTSHPHALFRPTFIPIVFSRMDRIRNVTAQVVYGLHYGFIIRAQFFHINRSTLSFDSPRGFQPSSRASWISFEMHAPRTSFICSNAPAPCYALAKPTARDSRYNRDSEARPSAPPFDGNQPMALFAAIKWPADEIPPAYLAPPPLPAPPPTGSFGGAAWKYDFTLHCKICLNESFSVPEFVHKVCPGPVCRVHPQARQLVLVLSVEKLNTDGDAVVVGVTKGIQWWNPGCPIFCRVLNRG